MTTKKQTLILKRNTNKNQVVVPRLLIKTNPRSGSTVFSFVYPAPKKFGAGHFTLFASYAIVPPASFYYQIEADSFSEAGCF